MSYIKKSAQNIFIMKYFKIKIPIKNRMYRKKYLQRINFIKFAYHLSYFELIFFVRKISDALFAKLLI